MSAVLITGATGNVGSRLVREYVDAADDVLYLLVRGRDQDQASERARAALGFWGVSLTGNEGRVRVVRGDICEPELGVSAATRARLQREVRRVVHAASSVRLDLSLAAARRMVVDGTRNVLRLAEGCARLEAFGYVSTAEVAGAYPGLVKEEFLTGYPHDFLNSYEAAKYEAEELLRARIAAGAPACIFRPTFVVGESGTGQALGFQSFYLMAEKLVLRPDYPILPRARSVDPIPVDAVARSIRLALASPRARGRVFHLASGAARRVPFARFRAEVAAAYEAYTGSRPPSVRYVDPAVFTAPLRLAALLTRGRLKRSLQSQLLFTRFLGLDWRVDTTDTEAFLRAEGYVWPQYEDYFPRLMDYFLRHRDRMGTPF